MKILMNMRGLLILSVLGILFHGSSGLPLDQIDEDTPFPPVIPDDSSQYVETGTEEYIDYEYSSSVERELKEIHNILFRNDNATTGSGDEDSSSSSATPEELVLQEKDRQELEIDEFIRQDPNFDFEPVGVEITAVVSHSPNLDQTQDSLSAGEIPDENQDLYQDYTVIPKNATEMVVKEPLDDLTLALTWWQILLLIAASLLLASLCCYFSGCCFLTSDCCADPFWGCCPCCHSCVRYTKPPPHTPKSEERDERRARSNYSLNENNTAPRSTIDRTTISTVRLEPEEGAGKVNGGGRNGESRGRRTPMKPDRRSSRTSVRQNVQSGQNSLTSGTSIHSVQPYTRRHSHNNSFRNSSGILVPGGRPGNSLHASSRSITRVEDSLKIARKESVLLRGEPSQDWIYEDSSGYFSWISKLGSGKKKQYSVYDKHNKKSSQKSKNKYRQSKYEHIADMRNSAVIPMKISKRASNASNYNVRHLRARSVESISSDEETVQPFLHTKTESPL